MHFPTLLSLVAAAQAATVGFNYGNTNSDGSFKDASTYEAEFNAAKSLAGTNGEFTSARIYTMIQGGTTDSVNEAIQAAISTGTTLLLGMWASQDQDGFNNEISALQNAISQYGSSLSKLVVGLSVGSEDLYRITPTGIQNNAGIGQSPEVLVEYIKQARSTVANTVLSDVKIGHVDTWTAWVNGSNFIVTDQCDWLGVDSYPYFQTTVANSIENGNATFWESYDNTVGAAQGKEVWVTETGWPVSGPVSGQAVASVANAETYWQDVACLLLPSYNTWWYTLQDAGSSPSFGLVGSNLDSAPLYDLTCNKTYSGATTKASTATLTKSGSGSLATSSMAYSNGTTSTGSAQATGASMSAPAGSAGSSPSMTTGAPASSVTSSPVSTNDAGQPKAAAVAGILAIFALVAAL